MTSTEIYNDINNIKKEIIKTIKKEDKIRFHLFKDALNKNSFPYYERKYEDFLINGNNDDIEDDKIRSIANYMNIDNLDYYYIVSSYVELFNNDYDMIFDIRQERRQLEIKYDELIKINEELEIKRINNNAKKEFIKKVIIIISIYLLSIYGYLYIQCKMK